MIVTERITSDLVIFIESPRRHFPVGHVAKPRAVDNAVDKTLGPKKPPDLSAPMFTARPKIMALPSEMALHQIGNDIEQTHEFNAALFVVNGLMERKKFVAQGRQWRRIGLRV